MNSRLERQSQIPSFVLASFRVVISANPLTAEQLSRVLSIYSRAWRVAHIRSWTCFSHPRITINTGSGVFSLSLSVFQREGGKEEFFCLHHGNEFSQQAEIGTIKKLNVANPRAAVAQFPQQAQNPPAPAQVQQGQNPPAPAQVQQAQNPPAPVQVQKAQDPTAPAQVQQAQKPPVPVQVQQGQNPLSQAQGQALGNLALPTEEKPEVKLFIYVSVSFALYCSSLRASVRNCWLFANVKCYWPRSETRNSLLFANVKC